ncbi:stationary phase inducible protein CsiE [Mixta sp.]|uniref:stationary phase inducible protein CsiE n=1 Tax=Mixta sp. TaxID=2100765 RepID=UPI0016803543|nr:stationary phase inducible protein CsiE [Mixta sp.]MCR1565631.1 stationary phase inducible protein CsiE [Mixta sp.]QNU42631.1 stationary phase inducible protein CsiE [Mixta calida]
MSSATTTAPLFSSSQRRCHLLLMLYLPDPLLTLESLCQLNGVDPSLARQDIAEVDEEIQRYHQLGIHYQQDGSLLLQGSELDRRLCLLHWLRRALRVSPVFIENTFTPALRQHLQTRQIEKLLYDEHNLQALIQHCAGRLQRNFSPRDRLFLQLFMQYSLCHTRLAAFNAQQRQWLEKKAERLAAQDVIRHWQRRCRFAPDASEIDFFTLLFSMIHAPSVGLAQQLWEQQLLEQTRLLIARFQAQSGMRFSDERGLCSQLYTHLAQALDRCHFAVGIDKSLSEEVIRLYPRLLRATRTAIEAFENHYGIRFSAEELGLIAVIFGAWLMQENALQEKQVLLLTGENAALESRLEEQLRELTLLPLSVKYLPMRDFQRDGAPKGVTLVISPYTTPLPLYSPPLIHAQQPFTAQQQQRIRLLLES